MVAAHQIERRLAPAKAGIKGDAYLRVLAPGEGQPVISKKHARLHVVAALEPRNLPPNLAEALRRKAPVE